MWGWGDSDPLVAPTATTHFGWGWGSPDPDSLFTASGFATPWSGTDIDWGWGDPAQLEESHITWTTPTTLPDDGGEIVELNADWSTVGPWTVVCKQTFSTGSYAANSATPGFATRCYTNTVEIEELGAIVTVPGTSLRFSLPVLPTGIYNLEITNGADSVVMLGAFEVIHRKRALETYAYRRRFPSPYELGSRSIAVDLLLGIDADADLDGGN